MRYVVESQLPFAPVVVWRVLADVRHFATDDPFHRDLEFLGEPRQGVGTRFKMRHRYLPIFPFPDDEVVGTVAVWEPERRLTLAEKNRWRLKDHTQQFTLEPAGPGTRLRYEIFYSGVPWLLAGWRLWARLLVRRRMAQKLREVEAACEA